MSRGLFAPGDPGPPPEVTPHRRAGGRPDPADLTIAEVRDVVEDHPEWLGPIYDDELAGKARTTLVDWLAARWAEAEEPDEVEDLDEEDDEEGSEE